MDLNPFAELQQYQLGSSLMGQPQASTPAVQPPVQQLPMAAMPQAAPQGQAPAPQGPPQNPAEYQQRVQGWRATMDELLANPTAAVLLMQMGTSMLSGRGARSMGDAMEAVGRMGTMENQLRRQGVQDSMLERKMGLEERELAAREKVWQEQAARYGRMGTGGGGGRGTATAEDPEITRAKWENDYQRFQSMGYDEATARAMATKQNYGMAVSQITPKADPMADDRLRVAQQIVSDAELIPPTTPEGQARLKQAQTIVSQALGMGGPEVVTGAGPAAAPPPGAGPTARGPTAQPNVSRTQVASPDELFQGIMRKQIQVGDTITLPNGASVVVTAETLAKAREWAKSQPNLGR